MELDNILNDYLLRATKKYGELPIHCKNVSIKIGCEENNIFGSSADTLKNEIIINPNDDDKEWALYHEMEHIRTAHSICENEYTGLTETVTYDFGYNMGFSLNEAITDFSVESLLNRQTERVSYLETKIYVCKLCVCLGITKDDLINIYNTKDINKFKSAIYDILSDKKFYLNFITSLDFFHFYHTQDIISEYSRYNKVENKPFGSISSAESIKYRKQLNALLKLSLKKQFKLNKININEYNKRLKILNSLFLI